MDCDTSRLSGALGSRYASGQIGTCREALESWTRNASVQLESVYIALDPRCVVSLGRQCLDTLASRVLDADKSRAYQMSTRCVLDANMSTRDHEHAASVMHW